MVLQERDMDAVDRKLINLLQEGLPLEKNPFGALAASLGISREEIVERIGALRRKGIVRRLGGVFDSLAMGYSSMLVGARVPEGVFGDVARFVNAHPGVTHNYRRIGFLNMWFTLSTVCDEERDAFLEELLRRFGLTHVFPFPRVRSFKLRVFFDMEGA